MISVCICWGVVLIVCSSVYLWWCDCIDRESVLEMMNRVMRM